MGGATGRGWLPGASLAILLGACAPSSPEGGAAYLVPISDPPCSAPSTAYRPEGHQRELHALLVSQDYPALQARVDALRRQSIERACSDRPFMLAFRGLVDGAPDLTPAYDGWVAELPHSADALAARGMHHKRRGEAIRGTRLASDTSRQRMQRMAEAMRLAAADLKAALALDPQHTVAAGEMLDAARHYLSAADSVVLYKRLAAPSPHSYAMASSVLRALSPKWGGSEALLRQHAADLAGGAAGNPDLALLTSLAECFLADDQRLHKQPLQAMASFASNERRSGDALDPVCWLYQARTEAGLDRDGDALASYLRHIEAVGPGAASGAAATLMVLERMDQARALLERGLTLDSGNPDLHCRMADLLFRQRQPGEAEAHLQRGLGVLPDSPYCRRVEAILSAARRDDPAARLARLEAVAADSQKSASYHLMVGQAQVQQQRYAEAIAPLDRAIVLDGGLAPAYYYRALAHEGSGALAQALSDAEQALRLAPDEPAHRTVLSRLRVANGRDLASAAADLERVVAGGESSANDLYALAGAYYKKRDCRVVPTLRDYLERCRSERCDATQLQFARNLLDNPGMRNECPG